MTDELFRKDSYLKTCEARVTAVDARGIQLDRTVFYPTGGGQPGDTGMLRFGATMLRIVDTIKDRETGEHLHIPEDGVHLPAVGDTVRAELDWARRYRHMRMHSALHLLCAAVDGGVTGGQIGETKSRLDFDLGEGELDKDDIQAKLNDFVSGGHPMYQRWISDGELAANRELVRTMSVQPPTGQGQVRLIEIAGGIDLQPCGGTHVSNTAEIGNLRVGKIENKGKRNRRVNIHLMTP